MFKSVTRLWPFLFISALIVGGIATYGNVCIVQQKSIPLPVVIESPIAFAPIIVSDTLQASPTRISPTERLSVTNGVCNTGNITLFVNYRFSLVPEPSTPVRNAFTISEGGVYLEPGQCEGETFALVLPSNTPLGPVRLAADITTMGPQSGQRQAAIMLSNVFEVVAQNDEQ